MWDEAVIPQQLKDASIIRLYKEGNRQLCGNYRGISLLAIAGVGVEGPSRGDPVVKGWKIMGCSVRSDNLF